jgi:hypothetical protein
VKAADAFVGVAAGDYEVGDLAVDLVVEVGEDGGREFYTASAWRVTEGSVPSL